LGRITVHPVAVYTLAVVAGEPLFIAMEETLSGKIVQGRVVRVLYANAKTWDKRTYAVAEFVFLRGISVGTVGTRLIGQLFLPSPLLVFKGK
jgi:hypothetical protein